MTVLTSKFYVLGSGMEFNIKNICENIRIITGEMPDLFYAEQLPYSVNLTATFTLLCFTKAMNFEFSLKKTEERV